MNGGADIAFSPVLPIWLIMLLGMLGALGALRRNSGLGWAPAALRLAAIVLLAGALSAPSRVSRSADAGPRPSLAMLIDTSASMGVCDVPPETGPSRFDALRREWFDPDTLTALADRANVHYRPFGVQAPAVGAGALEALTPDAAASNITGALVAALTTEEPVDRVLLLSDGASTDRSPIQRAIDLALARGARVDVVPVGSVDALDDNAVMLTASRSSVRAGDSVTLEIRTTGGVGRVTLSEVRTDGSVQTIFDRRTTGEPASVVARPPAPAGEAATTLYLATFAPESPDTDPRNNDALVAVEVRRAPIRVLVLEGRPSWQTRFLLDVLRSDARFETTSALAVGDRDVVRTHTADTDGSAVSAPQDLLQTADIVVLGRAVERWINEDAAQSLADRLARRGGVLVFLRGDPFAGADAPGRAALDALAPVAWGAGAIPDASFRPTGEAPLAIEQALSRVPGAMSTIATEGERSLARVWLRARSASTPTEPAAIATMRVGAGVTLAVLTDDLWRWATSPVADGPASFAMFWSAALRALSGEALDDMADVRLGIEPLNPVTGAPMTIRLTGLRAESARLAIETENGVAAEFEAPAIVDPIAGWDATCTPVREGLHRVRALGADGRTLAEAIFIAQAPAIELATTRANDELLASIADATGGRVYELDESGDYLAMLASSMPALRSPPIRTPLWNSAWVFACIGGLLLIEWTIRRLRGAV